MFSYHPSPVEFLILGLVAFVVGAGFAYLLIKFFRHIRTHFMKDTNNHG